MTSTTIPKVSDLGNVVKSTRARTVIYGAYVVGLVLVGATTAAFSQLGGSPEWLGVVESVMLYLGVPVGTLAAVNTKKPQLEVAQAYVNVTPRADLHLPTVTNSGRVELSKPAAETGNIEPDHTA